MLLEGGLPAPTSHLGDRSPKSLVTLGDVVLIDLDDGVYTRRRKTDLERGQFSRRSDNNTGGVQGFACRGRP